VYLPRRADDGFTPGERSGLNRYEGDRASGERGGRYRRLRPSATRADKKMAISR
jgi:hypothetical protein